MHFEDIKGSLTGYARIISYSSNNQNPESQYCELDSITEGHFVNGLKDGYCRGFSAIDGSCAAGFHKEGVPMGKFTSYKANGEFSLP